MRGSFTVARCACGAPVIGGHAQPQPNRFWCAGCVSFVEACIRGAGAFHGYLPDEGLDLGTFLANLEWRLIDSALTKARTVAGAARLLHINRTTLVEKLKRRRADAESTTVGGL